MANYVFGGNLVQPSQLEYTDYINVTANVDLAWPYTFADRKNVCAVQMDISVDEEDIVFKLPSALETGVGTSFFMNNIGSIPFDVNDNAGDDLTTIAPGFIVYFYLIDDSSAAGVWRQFVFGAGSSSANAAELAGYGLIAQVDGTPPAKLNTIYDILTETVDFSVDNTYMSSCVICTNQINASIPTGLTAGFYLVISNQSEGVGIVHPVGCEINGSTDNVLLAPEQSILLITDGTNWVSVGFNQINPQPAAELNVILTGTTYTLPPSTQASYNIFYFTGAIVSPCTVTLTASPGGWYFHNQTSQVVSLTAAGSVTVTLQPDQRVYVYFNQDTGNLYTIPEIPLPINQGGTGQATKMTAFNALAPTSAVGDMIYMNGAFNNVAVSIPGDATNGGQSFFSLPLGGGGSQPTWDGMAIINTTYMFNNTHTTIASLPYDVFGTQLLTRLLPSTASAIWLNGVVHFAPSTLSADTLVVKLQVQVNGGSFTDLYTIGILSSTANATNLLTSFPINYIDPSLYNASDSLVYKVVVSGTLTGESALNQTHASTGGYFATSNLVAYEIGNVGGWVA